MHLYYNNYKVDKCIIITINNEKRAETLSSTKGKSVYLLVGAHEHPRKRHSMSALWHGQVNEIHEERIKVCTMNNNSYAMR